MSAIGFIASYRMVDPGGVAAGATSFGLPFTAMYVGNVGSSFSYRSIRSPTAPHYSSAESS
ncbi:MAG: hypothetical protein AAF658_22030, partial [Myxococcota bacterium]